MSERREVCEMQSAERYWTSSVNPHGIVTGEPGDRKAVTPGLRREAHHHIPGSIGRHLKAELLESNPQW
jgi:hypothetical protein